MYRDMSFGLVVFALAGMASAQGMDDTSTVTISQPLTLAAKFKNGVEHRPALFGLPSYQASISGFVVYAVPGDQNGCDPIDSKLTSDWWPKNSPLIVMMDRGNCTFLSKVAHAEAAGAQAAIIVDNVDELNLPFMGASVTTGDPINIPSALIRLVDGATIKEVLKTQFVRMTLSWDVPRIDNRVEWDFWTSSDDAPALYFKKNFRKVAEALGDHSLLTPHYMVFDGSANCLQERDGSLPCRSQCTNGGRYCTIDPEHDLTIGLDGAHVIRENLRQKCLWKHLNETGTHIKWWDYINAFEENCHVGSSEKIWTPECSSKIMDELEVDTGAVFKCVEDSGGSCEDCGVNAIMDAEIALAQEQKIFILPSLQINGIPYYGGFSCPEPVTEDGCGVFAALCASFIPGSEPDACLQAADCVLGEERDECGDCYKVENEDHVLSCADCNGDAYGESKRDECGVCDGPGRDLCAQCFHVGDDRRVDDDLDKCDNSVMSIEVIIGIIIASVFVVGCGVYFYMKRQQNAMKEDIDQLLRQYLPMENGPPERNLIPKTGVASDSL